MIYLSNTTLAELRYVKTSLEEMHKEHTQIWSELDDVKDMVEKHLEFKILQKIERDIYLIKELI